LGKKYKRRRMRLNHLKVLSKEELSKIHQTSLRVLSETGVVIHNEKALRLLGDHGVKVDMGKERAWIPESFILEALSSIPSKIRLYNRDKGHYFTLGEQNNCLVGSGFDAVYVLDYETGERRKAIKEDVRKFARLSDALDNIDIVAVPAIPQDVEPESAHLHAVEAIFNETDKHLILAPDSIGTTAAILKMASTVIENEDLSHYPILSFEVSSLSPLSWEKQSAESLMAIAEAGAPCLFLPQPYAGVTAPITLAGQLTINNAETLSGIVITQLVRKESPVIYGSAWTTFDMREANVTLSSPETILLRVAGVQMAKFYNIPSHTTAPDSDSHSLDEQNAWEKALTLFSAMAAGVNVVINAGMFATGLTIGFEQLVMDNEITGIARRLIEGIDVSEEMIASEVIKRVGPKGQFLEDPHTLKHLRDKEHWKPGISNREIYENWLLKGKSSVVEKARKRAKEIMSTHSPKELKKEIKKRLSEIISDFERKYSRKH